MIMAETKRFFGIDFDALEPYIKEEYMQCCEWDEGYPEWKEKHPNEQPYYDWDEIFMRETDLDYISNFFGDDYHTLFGFIQGNNDKPWLWNEKEARQHILNQITPIVTLETQKILDMCKMYDVVVLDNQSERSSIMDPYSRQKIEFTAIRKDGRIFEFPYSKGLWEENVL